MSKYSQYFNKSLIEVHYRIAKNMSQKELKDRMESKLNLSTLNILFVIICSIIILENLLVLIAVFRNKKFHSAMFLLHWKPGLLWPTGWLRLYC